MIILTIGNTLAPLSYLLAPTYRQRN